MQNPLEGTQEETPFFLAIQKNMSRYPAPPWYDVLEPNLNANNTHEPCENDRKRKHEFCGDGEEELKQRDFQELLWSELSQSLEQPQQQPNAPFRLPNIAPNFVPLEAVGALPVGAVSSNASSLSSRAKKVQDTHLQSVVASTSQRNSPAAKSSGQKMTEEERKARQVEPTSPTVFWR